MDSNVIYEGNALELARQLEDESIQCIVASPPYWGLRVYNTASQIWADGRELCAEHEWTITPPRCNRSVGDALNSPKQQSSAGTVHTLSATNTCIHCGAWRGELGGEPTPELYVEHLVQLFRELRRALRKDGTAWLNLGDSYVGGGVAGSSKAFKGKQGTNRGSVSMVGKPIIPVGMKPKDLVGIPWLVAFALRADGWYLRNEIIWEKPNVMPSSVTDRLTVSHEQIFLLSKSPKYYYDIDAIREPHQSFDKRNITERSQKYRGKFNASNLETVNSPRAHAQREGYDEGSFYNPKGRNRRTVWHVNTKPLKEAHFATFPPDLITPCILAGCPEGGIVLDPFMGAGTTGVVAKSLRRNYVGFELNPEYIEIAKQRIANTPEPLFISDTKATFTKLEIVIPKYKQGKLI